MFKALPPGAYTVVVRGKNNTTGVGLVEVYDLGSNGSAKLANISTRGQVLTNDKVLIGGLIVQGPFSHSILFRALGTSLPGVTGVLPNPTLQLFNDQGSVIGYNDDWGRTQRMQIEATGAAPPNEQDAAILQTLGPGNYTAIVASKNTATGIALVEAYAH